MCHSEHLHVYLSVWCTFQVLENAALAFMWQRGYANARCFQKWGSFTTRSRLRWLTDTMAGVLLSPRKPLVARQLTYQGKTVSVSTNDGIPAAQSVKIHLRDVGVCVCVRQKEWKKGGWVASCGKSKVLLWKCKKIRDWRYWNWKYAKMFFHSLRRMNLWEVTHFAFSECVLTKCPFTPVFVWSVPGLGIVPAWNEPYTSFAISGQTAASGCHFSSKKQPQNKHKAPDVIKAPWRKLIYTKSLLGAIDFYRITMESKECYLLCSFVSGKSCTVRMHRYLNGDRSSE